MHINQTFELSMVLDNEKFRKVFDKVCDRSDCMERNEDEYIDHSLDSKGLRVLYRNSQYKKKIRVLVNSGLLDGKISDPDKFIRKLDKRVREYFGFKYNLDDFNLSGMTIEADISVDSRENVLAYLKVLQRIGRVKGFTPVNYECFDDNASFCLEGNSNEIAFLLYDLEGILVKQLRQAGDNRKELKSIAKKSEGILHAEVRLMKPSAIRTYTHASDIAEQITESVKNCRDIFLDIFTQIVPCGEFYKKDKAVEIIHKEVNDCTMRRRMLRLVALIPEKKSLYLAQKAMNCRNIEKVMDAFVRINLSPVTISKRHDIKHLRNIYSFLIDKE